MKHRVDVMIAEAEVQARIAELGAEISARYHDTQELVLVGLLRGSCVFLADLCREITVPVSFDFMTASSYGNSMNSSREVRILKDIEDEIKGKDVLIVEDIIDTGYTLTKVREILRLREPKSLAICGKAVITTVESISSMHSAQPMIIGTLRETGRKAGRGSAMVTQNSPEVGGGVPLRYQVPTAEAFQWRGLWLATVRALRQCRSRLWLRPVVDAPPTSNSSSAARSADSAAMYWAWATSMAA
jgi:hypoxanthine phosphoribosyltransferase